MGGNAFQQGQLAVSQLFLNSAKIGESNRALGQSLSPFVASALGAEVPTSPERIASDANERAQQKLEADIAEQDQDRRLGATSGLVGVVKRGIANQIPIEDIVERISPAAKALGFTDEDLGDLPNQIRDNPDFVNDLEAALEAVGDRKGARIVGSPQEVRLPDGSTALMQQFSDGTTRIIEDVTPLRGELAERRAAGAEERTRLRTPGVRGLVKEEEKLGTARGATRAEDLPISRAAARGAERDVAEKKQRAALVDDSIDQAIEQAGAFTAGLGSLLSVVPGTPAANLKATLNTIRANVGFDELQRLRDNSETGGALGQVSEIENVLLQSVLGALDSAQTPEQLKAILRTLKKQLKSTNERVSEAFEQEFGRVYEGPGTPILRKGSSQDGAVRVFNPDTGRLE